MVGGGYSHIATCILQHVKPLILKKCSGWMVLLLLKINSLSTSMLYSLVRVCACVCGRDKWLDKYSFGCTHWHVFDVKTGGKDML